LGIELKSIASVADAYPTGEVFAYTSYGKGGGWKVIAHFLF